MTHTLSEENLIIIINEILKRQGSFDISNIKINKMNDHWWLLSDGLREGGKNPVSADYIGKAFDTDNVEILAVLMIDENNFPCDFEIIKIDGGAIIIDVNEFNFEYIKSNGKP